MTSFWSRAIGSIRSLCIPVLLLLTSGCMDDPLKSLLADPARADRASLAVSYSLTSSAAARIAQSPVDRARVRLRAAGAVALDTIVVFPEGQTEMRVQLEVPLEQERETFEILVELMAGETVVARAEDTVTVQRGEQNIAQVVADVLFSGVGAGTGHSCHLTAEGKAYCWGSNDRGQVGDGTTSPGRLTPVVVAGDLTFAQVRAGGLRTCGLTTEGSAYCWGANNFGQLGDGTQTDRSTPTPVAGAVRFSSLDVSDRHACGRTAEGAVYCWGANNYGQLGDGTTTAQLTPVAVAGALRFLRITTGFGHTCGLVEGGTAYCWGLNAYGQVGNGATGGNVSAPTAVASGVRFNDLVAGPVHTCGIATQEGRTPASGDVGVAHCWGGNLSGQLGDGTTTSRPTPQAVSGSPLFRSLASQSANSVLGVTCGLTSDGTAHCWGSNSAGQVGTTSSATCDRFGSCVLTPATVTGGLRFQALATGLNHVCAISVEGRTYCWGGMGNGQLGNGSLGLALVPSPVAGNHAFTTLSAGEGEHTCGLASAGSALCWGRNQFGQLGNGTTTSTNAPVPVQNGGFALVETGGTVSCALDGVQRAFCWGRNNLGQVGDGTTADRHVPTAVTGGIQFTALDPTWSHVIARGADVASSAYFWGEGDPQTDAQINSNPMPVGVTGVADEAAGMRFTCYLDAAGAASCRGSNNVGQLGNGANAHSPSPVPVQGGHTFRVLTAGIDHACGLTPEGVAYCWGSNVAGELGVGNTTNSNIPLPVAGDHRFQSIRAGNGTTCAVTTGGAAYCWGWNLHGQLGDGTRVDRATPTQVSGSRTWRSIGGGGWHTCGLTTSGEALCWGESSFGRLGDAKDYHTATPVAVGGSTPTASPARGPRLTHLFRGSNVDGKLVWPSQSTTFVAEEREIRTSRSR